MIDLESSISSEGIWDRAFLRSITVPLTSYLLHTSSSCGLLVEGSLASGKSFLLKVLGDTLRGYGHSSIINLQVLYVDYIPIIECYKSGKSENMIMGLFATCGQSERRVLLFDNMDYLNLLPQRCRKSMYSILLTAIGQNRSSDRPFVIATVSSSSKIPMEFISTSRLSTPLILKSPDINLRRSLLCKLLSNESIFILNKDGLAEGAIDDLSTIIARKTGGYLAADLVKLVRDTYHKILIQQKGDNNDLKVTITYDYAMRVLDESLPTSMLANKSVFSNVSLFDLDNSSMPLLDPVGIDDTLLSLRSDILRPFLEPSADLSNVGRPCSGILICGPSGCGKTYLAEWISSRGSSMFRKIVVPCADLVNKVVGESEQKIANIFKIAREISPCFVIFDNLDIILGTNNSSDGGKREGRFSSRRTTHKALDRTLSTLLVEIDGISSSTNNNAEGEFKSRVVVIATSSNFDTIDRALKRPGRLEHHIDLSLPTEQQRYELIVSTIGHICAVSVTLLLDDSDRDLFLKERRILRQLATSTICKTHSEIVQIIRNSCYDLLRIQIRRGESGPIILQDICHHVGSGLEARPSRY